MNQLFLALTRECVQSSLKIITAILRVENSVAKQEIVWWGKMFTQS